MRGAYVLKDTVRFRYLRLSEAGLAVWQRIDGRRTLDDLSREVGEAAARATVRELALAGLVDFAGVDVPAPRVGKVESLVSRTFSVPDPDRALGLLYRFALRPLYGRAVQAALLAVAVAGAALYAKALLAGASPNGGSTLLFGLLGLEVHVVLHELGHAVTTKHFGRDVHRLGVGWYLFSPVAFVDTSDMWLEGRRRRMIVAAAGPYVNAVLAGGAGVLLQLHGGSFPLAFATTGYVLVLVNLNPLYELDGYYVLSDWLGIANLRAKSLAFAGGVLRRGPRTATDRRLRRIYIVYAVAAVAYGLFAAAALLLAYHRFVRSLVATLVPAAVASAVGWLLAGSLAGLLLVRLWRSVRRGARDRRVHRGGRRADRAAVTHGQHDRVEGAQGARGLEVDGLVPGRHRREREAQVEMVRHGDAADRREDVAGDQRAVARVEERDVTRRVTGAGDDLEAPDAVARREPDVGHGLQRRPASGHLALDDLLARVDAGVELRHQHLDPGQPLLQRVERADVVAVAVRQHDAPDRAAGLLRGRDQVVGCAAERRVDERDPVVLAHEVGVDEAQPRQLRQVRGDEGALHGVPPWAA
jgi:hypothetical protein